jgi:hypothetical protein
MASEWRDLEQAFGQDAHKLASESRGGSFGVILVVWLAFYGLAVAHTLLFPRTAAPALTVEARQQSPRAPLSSVNDLLVPAAIQSPH